jgi:hypothetical protein
MSEHELVRPDWVRRLNLFGPAVGDPALLVGLDPDGLLDAARASTGLDDFGDALGDDWEKPFRAVLSAMETNAGLTVIGRLSARAEVLRCLQMRLRLVELWNREPSVLATDVVAPVFILGPPRTGTSILLELLALDPNLRPVIAHEAHHPLGPPPGAGDHSAIECSEPEQEFWADIQPEFMTMHELRSDLPCECVHFCAPEFRSWHWPMMHDLGDLTIDGEDGRDAGPIYRWHKRFLQTLQHLDGTPRTFLLKSPAHLASLPDLLAVYPDARMIHTHRDPLKFVGSSANITATLHWMRSERLEKEGRGGLMSLAYQLMLGLVASQRDGGEVPADQMADLRFTDLMSDPVDAIERAYAQLGMDLPDVMRDSVPAYLADKPKGKFGPHRYDPVALGLDESQVRADFADYIDRYDIALEN